ncbi:hypothetical protein M408DRAFT_72594 [Serendipita vermifera MAFF 305830]|uniref:Vacuolar protein-sorting-associated protein 36 n=1 Tax=Serendipita vermifera MAFF 305830 TaxID=933852 RepID=A0A0C2XBU7_SERVB|nr:hypothetical protein M408DRAFT_72594 [Serendipita vermifera MAFF 305830]
MEAHGTAIDGSIAVPALLYPDETLLGDQDGVGLYEGNNKAPNHQLGSIHVTSHRLIYIDTIHPRRRSLEFELRRITQTEFYAGFLTSSAKITLFFQPPNTNLGGGSQQDRETTFRWECEICGNVNVYTGLVPPSACQLCGIPRAANKPPQPEATTQPRDIPTSHSSYLSPGHSRSDNAQLACSICTFLNHPSLRNCEMCGTPLPKRTNAPDALGPSRVNKSAPASRPSSPESKENINILKISFRRGGDKAFYATLKTALEAKVWDVVEPQAKAKNRTGIHGLVELRRNEVESTQTNMDTALTDLEALMNQAGEMVALAEEFNRVLMEHEAQRQQLPEDAQFIISSSMARLGLTSPVLATTNATDAKEEGWLEDLAKQLAVVLTGAKGGSGGGLMHARGMIALDEVWGAWNRVRGVSLIPPSTFMQVLPLLSQHTNPPVLTRAFHSNLKVVHTPWYSQREFTPRLLAFLEAAGPKSTVQVAQQESIAVGLIAEMIAAAEQEGRVVRDEESEGMAGKEIKWWPNYFEGYVWDGD